MRTISLTNHLEFEFTGSVLRKGLTIGDVDNDGNNELIIGNISGEVAIFKGGERWQTINNLGFVSCISVGDIFNKKRNCLLILTGDGWCYIYASDNEGTSGRSPIGKDIRTIEGVEEVDGQVLSGESVESSDSCSNLSKTQKHKNSFLKRVHVQRIPANSKVVVIDRFFKDCLLGDIDGDGLIEMVLGLTDRVVRSYRWVFNTETNLNSNISNSISGKLVGLNKWECAKQIGSITLHHSCDGKPSILVAQPGGTFMRIRCHPDAILESSDNSSNRSENFIGSTVDYQFLGISRMRNQNVSTEVLGNLNTKCIDHHEKQSQSSVTENVTVPCKSKKEEKICRGTPYAVVTLDGTTMLVQDEVILWSIAVDHQIFALSKLDVTENGVDDIVLCTWDGHTYLFDQEKNTVRFQIDESVQGFECGYYNLSPGDKAVPCFVYLTFRNKILLYYNIPLKDMICRKYNVNIADLNGLSESGIINAEELKNLSETEKKELVEYLLYGVLLND